MPRVNGSSKQISRQKSKIIKWRCFMTTTRQRHLAKPRGLGHCKGTSPRGHATLLSPVWARGGVGGSRPTPRIPKPWSPGPGSRSWLQALVADSQTRAAGSGSRPWFQTLLPDPARRPWSHLVVPYPVPDPSPRPWSPGPGSRPWFQANPQFLLLDPPAGTLHSS